MQAVPGRQRRSVDISELNSQAEALVDEVHTSGESIDITADGQVVAEIRSAGSHVNGAQQPIRSDEELAAWKRGIDELAAEISAHWPEGVSAEDAINDVRREL